MPSNYKLGTTATKVIVRYHNTDVVSFNDKEITLDTGGWWTITTKERMNQASSQFNLGYYVSQCKGQWSVSYQDKVIEFKSDTITLKR